MILAESLLLPKHTLCIISYCTFHCASMASHFLQKRAQAHLGRFCRQWLAMQSIRSAMGKSARVVLDVGDESLNLGA